MAAIARSARASAISAASARSALWLFDPTWPDLRASLRVDHRHAAARPAGTHAPDAALQGELGASRRSARRISPSISIPSNRSRTGTSSTVCGSLRARPFDGSANALPASLQHHERWDSFSGTNRLCSPRRPQTSRTVCADRGRSRPQWGRSHVFDSCRRVSGRQFCRAAGICATCRNYRGPCALRHRAVWPIGVLVGRPTAGEIGASR